MQPAIHASSAALAESPGDYYRDNGYAIFPGLVQPAAIDHIMSLYRRDILRSGQKFFRQNTNRYESNRLNEFGYVVQSFLDVHHYTRFPEFQKSLLNLYFSPAMLAALTELTGSPRHNLMQSMLFDLNAETPPHQDWWYLDSVPGGGLLACWVALEDIHEDAGRFYVMPGTQNVRLHEEGLPHNVWLQRMRAYLDANRANVYAPAMRKGDVLFWNSRTVHGALATRNPAFSRKSLTAHYLPSEMTFGNLFAAKPWVAYQDWQGQQYFANQPEYSVKADLVSRVKTAVYNRPGLLKLARRFQKRSIAEI